MTEVIGFWMAMTILILPVIFWGSVVSEVLFKLYLNHLTGGRYTEKSKLYSWFCSWTETLYNSFTPCGGFVVVFSSILVGLNFLITILSLRGDLTILGCYTKVCLHLTWIFWPVTICVIWWFIHKILKKIVTFGYKVYDHLEGSDK